MAYQRTQWENNATALSAQNMNNIEDGIEEALALIESVTNVIYPVGSIYMSATLSTHEQVEALFGGAWVAWGAGRVPIGVDAEDTMFDEAEEEGGSATHTHTNPTTGDSSAANTGGTALSVANLPSHSHTMSHSHGMAHTHGTGSSEYANFVTSSVNVGNDAGSSISGSGYSYPRTGSLGGFNQRTATGQPSSSNTGGSSAANTGAVGSGTAHSHSMAHTHTMGDTGSASNIQPYITCYMYKRVG